MSENIGSLSAFKSTPETQIKGELVDDYVLQSDGENTIIRRKPNATVNRKELLATMVDDLQNIDPGPYGVGSFAANKTGPVPLDTENDEW